MIDFPLNRWKKSGGRPPFAYPVWTCTGNPAQQLGLVYGDTPRREFRFDHEAAQRPLRVHLGAMPPPSVRPLRSEDLAAKDRLRDGEGCRRAVFDEERFDREGVAPGWLGKPLFGEGGVQGLDGPAHTLRKAMFMAMMTPGRVERLGAITTDWLRVYARKWAGMDRGVLYDEMSELLTRAVCDWAGVPLRERDVSRRSAELTAMFDQAAPVGPGHLQARLARKRAERWIGDLIEEIRDGRLGPPKYSVANTIGFLKGKSAVRIHRELLKERRMTGLHFWATGYCVSTVGLEEARVRQYIREQDEDELDRRQGELNLE